MNRALYDEAERLSLELLHLNSAPDVSSHSYSTYDKCLGRLDRILRQPLFAPKTAHAFIRRSGPTQMFDSMATRNILIVSLVAHVALVLESKSKPRKFLARAFSSLLRHSGQLAHQDGPQLG